MFQGGGGGGLSPQSCEVGGGGGGGARCLPDSLPLLGNPVHGTLHGTTLKFNLPHAGSLWFVYCLFIYWLEGPGLG